MCLNGNVFPFQRSLPSSELGMCLIGSLNLPKTENGRLSRDGSTSPNQTQDSAKLQVSK